MSGRPARRTASGSATRLAGRLRRPGCAHESSRRRTARGCDAHAVNRRTTSLAPRRSTVRHTSSPVGSRFVLLTRLGVRDRQYKIIYDRLGDKYCAFCGLQLFASPGTTREDLDHFLYKEKYPFAAANLQNLSPMCHPCNSDFKGRKDVLVDAQGTRREAFNPYGVVRLEINLEGTIIPTDTTIDPDPIWQLNFIPDSPEIRTWDEVFEIRKRYSMDVLRWAFWRWIQAFGTAYREQAGVSEPSDDELLAFLQYYEQNLRNMGAAGAEFLRAPVFRMLRVHCSAGNARFMAILRGAIAGPRPFARAGDD